MNLKERRQELRMSLQDVADKVGVSKTTIMRWENGDIENMKRDKIEKLSSVLGISPLQILDIKRYQNQEHFIDSEIGKSQLTRILKYAAILSEFSEENRKDVEKYIDLIKLKDDGEKKDDVK